MFRSLMLGSLFGCMAVGNALAGYVYSEPAALEGTRTASQLVLGGDYVGSDLSISWKVTENGSLWNYMYTIDGFQDDTVNVRVGDNSNPGISHFTLDLTDDAVDIRNAELADLAAVTNVQPAGETEFKLFAGGSGDPGWPSGAEIIGVKFNFGGDGPEVVYSFTSNRAPVWGDFYLKGGDDSYAYNMGLTNHQSENVLDFIARPNGVIPEPGTLAVWTLLTAVGCGLAYWRRNGQAK